MMAEIRKIIAEMQNFYEILMEPTLWMFVSSETVNTQKAARSNERDREFNILIWLDAR